VKLSDFSKVCNGSFSIEVRSAYNGKVLARHFTKEKHPQLCDREVVSCWPDIRARNGFAQAVLSVYLHGDVELEKELKRKEERT
jgi:hypothetical protein